jgi:hypothetical protein
MKNLMEQRICSSIQAGLNTARMLLEGQTIHEEEDDQEIDLTVESDEESEVLSRLIARLERIEQDPKLNAVLHYLEREKWLEYPAAVDWRQITQKLQVQGEPRVYVIRKSFLDPDYRGVKRNVFPTFTRTIDSLIRTQGIGDFYQIYALCKRDGNDFNLAYIPRTPPLSPKKCLSRCTCKSSLIGVNRWPLRAIPGKRHHRGSSCLSDAGLVLPRYQWIRTGLSPPVVAIAMPEGKGGEWRGRHLRIASFVLTLGGLSSFGLEVITHGKE